MQGNKYSDNQNKRKAPRAGRKTMKGKKFVNKPSTKSIGGGFVVYRPPDLSILIVNMYVYICIYFMFM